VALEVWLDVGHSRVGVTDLRGVKPMLMPRIALARKPTVKLSITHKWLNRLRLHRHKNLESNELLVIPC
jgi:hypothetical protein